MQPSIEHLKPEEGEKILRRLWEKDELRGPIRGEITRFFEEVEQDNVAERVYDYLGEKLSLDELNNRAGSHQHGYVEPTEAAVHMVEEVAKYFLGEVERYQELQMDEQALQCCLGILIGFYNYAHETKSEAINYFDRDLRNTFGWVRDRWKRECSDEERRKQMRDELEKHCPEWVSR